MSLFDFGKKTDEVPSCCCCKSAGDTETKSKSCSCELGSIRSVKVLGAGCKACREQYENVKKALCELGIFLEPEYITDMEKVMTYGVMSMPAIVVNEQVVSMGRVLKPAEVVKLLSAAKK